jgi:hypothetical protein
MKVTSINSTWNNGVNIEKATGPDDYNTPQPRYPRQYKRMNYNSVWKIDVPDAYDFWHRRDLDPDHPTLPPSYQNEWNHILNNGEDREEDAT